MARKKSAKGAANAETAVLDYRHDEAKRKNIPPAGLAAQGKVRETPKIRYAYDPHLPPVLRFDPAGGADRLPELLEMARSRPLSAEEARLLGEALRNRKPWLQWSGKREKKSFEVDHVALHIRERISAQAILKVIARQDVQRDLFADHAEQEELVDQPEVVRHVGRVSGPFTMEAVMPAEESLTDESPIGDGLEESLDTFGGAGGGRASEEIARTEGSYTGQFLRKILA